jgi:hypothetical protein
MNEFGIAFDGSVPIHRFQGAEIETLLVNSITVTLQLTEGRQIHLDYQGCVEHRNTWLCGLPLCGDNELGGSNHHRGFFVH